MCRFLQFVEWRDVDVSWCGPGFHTSKGIGHRTVSRALMLNFGYDNLLMRLTLQDPSSEIKS